MSNLINIFTTGTQRDLNSLIESMSDEDILSVCTNPENFIKLYDKHRSYLFYEDDMEEESNCIIDALLECKKSKNCILTIFRNKEINQILTKYDYCRYVSVYEKLIRCELISDEDIIAICKNCFTFIIKDYYDDGDIYYTYTELTDIFKYILENRPQYAKYLVAMEENNFEFSFWHYALLEYKDNIYSEMFKELLISDIYKFNRIRELEGYCAIEESIIIYGCDINYFDTILLIMEVINKCNIFQKRDINYIIFISLKIVLCGIVPPIIYDIYTTSSKEINIYFILAFCYLNMFEGASIELLKDFCQSIYIYDSLIRNIDSGIQLAIEYAPNTKHLKKY